MYCTGCECRPKMSNLIEEQNQMPTDELTIALKGYKRVSVWRINAFNPELSSKILIPYEYLLAKIVVY